LSKENLAGKGPTDKELRGVVRKVITGKREEKGYDGLVAARVGKLRALCCPLSFDDGNSIGADEGDRRQKGQTRGVGKPQGKKQRILFTSKASLS